MQATEKKMNNQEKKPRRNKKSDTQTLSEVGDEVKKN